MTTQRIITLVTGGNRGIGFEIVRSLAAYFSIPSHSDGKSFTFFVGGRQKESVEAGVKELGRALETEGIKGADVQGVLLNVCDDKSIRSAVEDVKRRFSGLNVLVNNAGIAKRPSSSLESMRETYRDILDTNVISVANVITAFAPLLQAGGHRGLVVNISSARGSIIRLTDPSSPKSQVIAYSMSKVALNGLTLELAKAFDGIEFQIVNPGHCATAFNNYSGSRDPREGATAVVLLVERWLRERNDCGFWETEGSSLELSRVPW